MCHIIFLFPKHTPDIRYDTNTSSLFIVFCNFFSQSFFPLNQIDQKILPYFIRSISGPLIVGATKFVIVTSSWFSCFWFDNLLYPPLPSSCSCLSPHSLGVTNKTTPLITNPVVILCSSSEFGLTELTLVGPP
jgi:hypothetical protein